jgi:hypothetical protein
VLLGSDVTKADTPREFAKVDMPRELQQLIWQDFVFFFVLLKVNVYQGRGDFQIFKVTFPRGDQKSISQGGLDVDFAKRLQKSCWQVTPCS